MKRYLLFQSPSSNFDLISPQYTLCGSPRVVVLTPISNASTFLWEQLEPNPILFPVTITPNVNSKDITVSIQNNITSSVKLKVTLNNDPNNFRIVILEVNLIDYPIGFSNGNGFTAFNDTLKDSPQIIYAPLPLLGPRAILFTNNQTTGVSLIRQTYRNTFIKKYSIFDTNEIFIDDFETRPYSIYNTTYDPRININVNTDYKLEKIWDDIKINNNTEKINFRANLSTPQIISDEFIKGAFNTGVGVTGFTRTPFLVQNQSLTELVNSYFSTGVGVTGFTRTPFLVQNQSLTETINIAFTVGVGFTSFTRTPYSTNIIG